MADTIKTNLGPVTAYADAKAHGYTGTREEFGQLLANAGLNLKAAETAKADAEAAKQAAETAQQAAAENQKNTETQAANAKASADTAAEQAAVAKESAADAANSATAAQESETNAGLSATAAANAEAAAKQAQNAAETAKADAETAKTAAGNSADAAANSAADAKKTLESIPADYSALSGKVDENTSGISELKEDTGTFKDEIIGKNLLTELRANFAITDSTGEIVGEKNSWYLSNRISVSYGNYIYFDVVIPVDYIRLSFYNESDVYIGSITVRNQSKLCAYSPSDAKKMYASFAIKEGQDSYKQFPKLYIDPNIRENEFGKLADLTYTVTNDPAYAESCVFPFVNVSSMYIPPEYSAFFNLYHGQKINGPITDPTLKSMSFTGILKKSDIFLRSVTKNSFGDYIANPDKYKSARLIVFRNDKSPIDVSDVKEKVKIYIGAPLQSPHLIPEDYRISRGNRMIVEENIDGLQINQTYRGGYIELQPDSYTPGTIPATDKTTDLWGFPQSLLPTEQNWIKNNIFPGDGTGIMYLRLPLGFAYRGYRNLDPVTGLAKNIGQRYEGQNVAIKNILGNVVKCGGGLAPEYWCPPPYWVTSGHYNGENYISAGINEKNGTTQETKLKDIKTTFPTQYAARIESFTDSIVDDLEYLHQNIAPVRMFGLQNEPETNGNEYGTCGWDSTTYNDVLEVLIPKIKKSDILNWYNGNKNDVKIHVGSTLANDFNGIPSKFISKHGDWIWGYSHHYGLIHPAADDFKGSSYINGIVGNRKNVFCNEYEYFSIQDETDYGFANNVNRMINELVYGKAEVLMPVIHICKPIGQISHHSNTAGYCMFMCNLPEDYGIAIIGESNRYGINYGTKKENRMFYNSWKFISDNVNIGSYIIGGLPQNTVAGFSYCVVKYAGKIKILVCNCNDDKSILATFNFQSQRMYREKIYTLDFVNREGITHGPSKALTVEIPIYTAICIEEI